MGRRKTHEEFVEDFILKSRNSDKIEILGTFTEWKIKIPCRCKICNYEWDVRPDSLLRGSACPKCANFKKSIAYRGRHIEQDLSIYEKRFIEKFENANNHLELLGDYNGIHQKIKESSNPVDVYDLTNNIVHAFLSVAETSRKMNELYTEKFPVSSLRNRCKDQKPYKGFIFKYAS